MPQDECTCFYKLVKLTKPNNSVRLGLDECEFYFQRVILLHSTLPEKLDLPNYVDLLINAREIYIRPNNELMYRQGKHQLVRPHVCAETDLLISFVREHHRQQMIKMGKAKTGEARLRLIRASGKIEEIDKIMSGAVPADDAHRCDYLLECLMSRDRSSQHQQHQQHQRDKSENLDQEQERWHGKYSMAGLTETLQKIPVPSPLSPRDRLNVDCPILDCPKKSMDVKGLSKHLLSQHGERGLNIKRHLAGDLTPKYICIFCIAKGSGEFPTLDGLQVHLEQKHDKENDPDNCTHSRCIIESTKSGAIFGNFLCELCASGFKTSRYLVEHFIIYHGCDQKDPVFKRAQIAYRIPEAQLK